MAYVNSFLCIQIAFTESFTLFPSHAGRLLVEWLLIFPPVCFVCILIKVGYTSKDFKTQCLCSENFSLELKIEIFPFQSLSIKELPYSVLECPEYLHVKRELYEGA